MKGFDPRVKLAAVFLSTVAAVFLRDPCALLALAVLTLLIAVFLGAEIKGFFGRFRHFALVLLGVAVMQAIFVRTGEPIVRLNGFVLFYADGLLRGGGAFLRYFVILCAAAALAAENPRRVIQSLVQMMLPYTFAFLMSVTLRFLPYFAEAFRDSMVTVQLRGVELKKVPIGKRLKLYSYLLLPVVAEAVVRAQELAAAMEARGFGALPKRTSLFTLRLRARDYAALTLLPFLYGVLIYMGTK